MSTRKSCKKCFVPGCTSNAYDQPLKPFIRLPSGTAIRKQWAQVVGRTDKHVFFDPVSSIYCCGDHFNLKEDAENWMKYRMMGGTIKLKPGVLPRILKKGKEDSFSLGTVIKTEQSFGEYDRLQTEDTATSHENIEYNIGTQTIDEYSIDIKYEPLVDNVKTEPEEPFFEQMYAEEHTNEEYRNTEPENKTFSHKDIQCNIRVRKHVRSKSTQTDKNVIMCSRATSPIKFRKQRKK